MPPVGKELENQPVVDDIAVREVEGYIDRVEKQVESPPKDNQTQTQPIPLQIQTQISDMGKTVSAQFAVGDKPKILLPLNKEEIEYGSKKKVSDSIKWLSEWCIYMIKKYPGRVFYSPTSINQ